MRRITQIDVDFFDSQEFGALIALTKSCWDECDYMGNPGASEEAIDKFKKEYRERFDTACFPEEYLAFLRKHNGLKYTGFEIFGYKYDGGWLQSDRNVMECNNDFSEKHFLQIGSLGEKNSILYGLYDNTYWLKPEDDLLQDDEAPKQFDSFAAMFRYIMCKLLLEGISKFKKAKK